jgi:hypothetical protein
MSMMLRLCVVFMTIAGWSHVSAQTCTGDDVDTEKLTPYASNSYTVLRNGKPVGDHTIKSYYLGQAKVVQAETKMEVNVLFFSAFKYHYRSREIWCGHALEAVHTVTNDNGKDIETTVTRTADGFQISRTVNGETKPPVPVPGNALPTSHWNMNALRASNRIHTIKGYVMDTTVVPVTEPAKPSEHAVIPEALAFRVTAKDYDYTTYYDDYGHWHGMSFHRGRAGFIEFRCEDCANAL